MEFEEMKNLWQKYDKAMADNRILNEKLINELLQNKSGNSVRKMLNAEYFGLAFCIILLCIFISLHTRAWTSAIMAASFFLNILFIGVSITASIYKIRVLSSIDFSKSIVDLTYKVQRFKLFISRERIIGAFLLPVIVLASYIFIAGSADRFLDYLPGLILGCAAGIPVAFILYRSLYFDNIKQIIQCLDEAKFFRQESV